MVFSSFTFLFLFFPITIILYYLFKNRKYRNIILLIMSLIFYTWGEPIYILLMLFSITINYIFALMIDKYDKKRKLFLVLDIIINILLIFIFKYIDFGILSINSILFELCVVDEVEISSRSFVPLRWNKAPGTYFHL